MLKRIERIRRAGFKKIAEGRATHTPLFTLRMLPSDAGHRQFSVVVSKKVAKTAVARNALRRKVYAALQECGPANVHAIVYMKPDSMNATFEQIHVALQSLLNK
jgi:ribonuclease P protein component